LPLKELSEQMLPAVEQEMKDCVAQAQGPGLEEFHHMLAYQMGWEGQGAGQQARGKRLRPLLVLLSNAAAGGNWKLALPAAAAVELVHNFSLIHDDIQDNSDLRRGRPTVWNKWDQAQAINAGDAIFALAHIALMRLAEYASPQIVLRAACLLPQTCLALTQGQYLDLAYEAQGELTVDSYWPMVEGKTASLLAACTQLGALVAEADLEKLEAYRAFGHVLGLAFQARDDLLGIWGDAVTTGKSAHSDLLSGKKSLPVLYALERGGEFGARWKNGDITPEQVPELAALLESEGARAFAEETVARLTDQALAELQAAKPHDPGSQALAELTRQLVNRTG